MIRLRLFRDMIDRLNSQVEGYTSSCHAHFPNDSPYSSLFYQYRPTTILNMALHRHPSPRCHSAGRVTAKLLLSFLALSPPTAASASYQQQHHPVPLLPPFPGRPELQIPSNNEHVFVSLNKNCSKLNIYSQ